MTVAKLKGVSFLGVVGRFEDGRVEVAVEPGVDSASIMAHAVVAFLGLMSGASVPKDNSGDEWLQRLWDLPDTRT